LKEFLSFAVDKKGLRARSKCNERFEQVFLPSPYAGEEDMPMPCGWKVRGAHQCLVGRHSLSVFKFCTFSHDMISGHIDNGAIINRTVTSTNGTIKWVHKQIVCPADFLKTRIVPVVEAELNALKGSAAEGFFRNAAQRLQENPTLLAKAPRLLDVSQRREGELAPGTPRRQDRDSLARKPLC
jgi:hypothetical protein